MQNIILSDIRIYPVKSLTGISVDESSVFPHGLNNDRLLMLIDDSGLFITQRKYPQLALVNTNIDNDKLRVTAPDRPDLMISENDFASETIYVKIWRDECDGRVASEKINHWFSRFLNMPVRLIKYNHKKSRAINPDYSQKGDIVSYADAYPLLVISKASLDDLNSRLQVSVTMNNFRPNLIVDGCEAYAEDIWKKIRIGKVEFDAVKKCDRCILTTIDPKTGIKDANRQPFNTLTEYRKEQGGVMFGMNLIPRSNGTLYINDQVEIIN